LDALVVEEQPDIQEDDQDNSNIVLTFSSEPAQYTNELDKITQKLFEWIELKEKATYGRIIFPDVLKGLKHKGGLETTQSVFKSIKLTNTINRNAAFWQLLQYLTDQKIHEADRIEDFVPIVEKRAHISLNDYLGKQSLQLPIQT
jgi:hypothetical protein